MANRNFPNSRLYSPHVMPVLIDTEFTVNSTDTAGLGITGLKGTGFIKNVFMHTSSTPAAGSPNPAAGYISVTLSDPYFRHYQLVSAFVSPLTGSPATSITTAHVPVVITSLGTATLAQWQAKGFPVGVTPAVGMSFIATATGTIGGSAHVDTTSVSGIMSVEMVQSPSMAVSNDMPIILQCLNTSGTPTAPADGTSIKLSFVLSNSSIQVGGF